MKVDKHKGYKEIKFKVGTSKIDFSADFIKKIYAIANFLNERYEINSNNVVYDHYFEEDEAKNKIITISLRFYDQK